jgi:hypothetical protein
MTQDIYNLAMPRKKQEIKRDEYIRVNLLPAEKAYVESRAAQLDVSLSHVIRLLIKADMAATTADDATAHKPTKTAKGK